MVNEAKHTPGPWEANNGEGYSIWSIYAPSRSAIARVIGDGAETDANANLIAAAPELLEKCKKVRSWLLRLAENSEKQAVACGFETLKKAYEHDARNYRSTAADIDSVIAKAEGSGAV